MSSLNILGELGKHNEEFGDFTQRHSDASLKADQIIQQQQERQEQFEEWRQSGGKINKRLEHSVDDKQIVQLGKKPRSIEPEARFGQFTFNQNNEISEQSDNFSSQQASLSDALDKEMPGLSAKD